MTDIITEAGYPSGWDTDRNGKRWEDYDTIKCPDGTIVDMVKLLDDQARACAAITHLAPAFGGFVGKLRFIYTFRVQTQATDGYNLFINPQFTAGLSFAEKTFVLAHEIMHCLLNHMRRGASHDPNRSNIAADYEVNISLVQMKLFKEGTIQKIRGLVDGKYAGWGYEKIYDEITSSAHSNMSNQSQAQQAQQNQQGSGQGSGQGSPQQQEYSADYKAGWAQAIADWKAKNGIK